MYHSTYQPTTRVLAVLELLQSQGNMSGPELAARLEVDVRSIRRYITMLKDMGIPVESEPGRYGTYYLRPGFRLPPLMFNHTEILAVILGLVFARHMGLTATIGVESAAAKIERVLPYELRERARALQTVLRLDMPSYRSVGEDRIALFSLAAYQHCQMRIAYQAVNQERSERTIDVYGLVFHTGSWYATGYCHLRGGLRTFRLDRVVDARLLETTFEPPENFDPLDFLLKTIASMSSTWTVEVLLHLSLDEAKQRIPPDVAVLEERPDGVLFRAWAESLEWVARYLVSLRCSLRVLSPPELRAELLNLSAFIASLAEG
jgi:predicted DNA-binding transcriptional regulator YafY